MLRSCIECSKYKIPTVECDETIHLQIIKFHIYEVFTICSKHGTIETGNLICHIYSESISVVKEKIFEAIKKKYTNFKRVIYCKVYEGVLHTCVGKVFVSHILCTCTF